MGFFDNFFRDGPEIKFSHIPPVVADWWNSIDGVQSFAGIIVKEIAVTVILCPTTAAMQMEYRARRKMDLPEEAAGVKWEDGGKVFILLLYKVTQAGNKIVDEWALGHEVAHVLPISDPDDVDKETFYNL